MKDEEMQIVETVEKAVRKNEDNAGKMADLLNQELEDLQKAKRIEEMDEDLIRAVEYDIENSDLIDSCSTAIKLIKLGWIKPAEDCVLLSREEYEEYKKVVDGKAIMVENITDLNKLVQFPIEYDNKTFDDIADFGNYVQEQAKKEILEKIYLQAKAIVDATKHIVQGREYLHIDALKEIVKSCGVEIKE